MNDKINFILDDVMLNHPDIAYNHGVLMFGCGDHCPECKLKSKCEDFFNEQVPNLRDEEAKDFIDQHPEFLI